MKPVSCFIAVIVFCAIFGAPSCHGDVVYRTNFTQHYFDAGTFAVGNLTGDGWLAPLSTPWQVQSQSGNQYIQAASSKLSVLDLVGQGASVTGKTAKVTCGVTLEPNMNGAVTLLAYQGTARTQIIGKVVFTKGAGKSGQVQLVGSSTVTICAVTVAAQQVDWRINLVSKTMSLSINGCAPVSTGFINSSYTTLSQFGLTTGSLGTSMWGRVDDLSITTPPSNVVYQTNFTDRFFEAGTFADGDLTGDGWLAPQSAPWQVVTESGNKVIKAGTYKWSQLDLVGKGASVTGKVVRVTCSVTVDPDSVEIMQVGGYQGTNYTQEIGWVRFTAGANNSGLVQLVGSSTVTVCAVADVPQQVDWKIDLVNKTMSLSIDGCEAVTTGFINSAYTTLDQLGIGTANIGYGYDQIDDLRISTQAPDVIYQADFDQHYFDAGIFADGNLTGDGWLAPQSNPWEVITQYGNKVVRASTYDWSQLDLVGQGASVTGKVVRITCSVAPDPNSVEEMSLGAWQGTNYTQQIGWVYFTKGVNQGGLVQLVGSSTVTACSVAILPQQVDWRIDLVNKTMTLSIDGGPTVSTGFINPAYTTLDQFSLGTANIGYGWDRVDDLCISTPAQTSCNLATQQLSVGDLTAQVDCSGTSIYRSGVLVLRDQVKNLNGGTPQLTTIQDQGLQGVELKWDSPNNGVTKRKVVVKSGEVLLEYSTDLLNSFEAFPAWGIRVYMPESVWGNPITAPTEAVASALGVLVGNSYELQFGQSSKLWDPAYFWLPQPRWGMSITSPTNGEYSIFQTALSSEDPAHLRSVVRLLTSGSGIARGLDGDYVDRGNPAGNLDDIIDHRFTVLATRDRKFCKQGESVNVTLRNVSDDVTGRQVPIVYDLTDAWGQIVNQGNFTFDTSLGSYMVPLSPSAQSAYRWSFDYTWDGVQRSNEAIFSVFPVLQALPFDPESQFDDVVYQTDFTQHFFDTGTFTDGNLTGDGWDVPQGAPWQVITQSGNKIIEAGNYKWSQLDLAGKGATVTDKIVRVTCSVQQEPNSAGAVTLAAYKDTSNNEIGHVIFTLGANQGGLVQLVGSTTVTVCSVAAVPQQVDWRIDLLNGTMSLSIDGGTAVSTGFMNSAYNTLAQFGIGSGNIGDSWAQVDDLHISTPAPDAVYYKTDFTQHYFDADTFADGNLTGDGWLAPQANPLEVYTQSGNKVIRASTYDWSQLDLAGQGASMTGKIARVTCGVTVDPNSIDVVALGAWQGTNYTQQIGWVYFTKGANNLGLVQLVGSTTVTVCSVSAVPQQVDWRIDLMSKTMSLSIDGRPPVTTGFINSSYTTLDQFSVSTGNIGYGWDQIDNLRISTLEDSFVGTHNPTGHSLLNGLFRTMGVKWNRWWDIGPAALWYSVEPTRYTYTWGNADVVMNNDQNLDATSLVQLDQCYFPQWVYDIQGYIDSCTTSWLVSDPIGYAQMFASEYAQPVAQHFLNEAKYYEIGNEVYFQWRGAEANYVTLLSYVYPALKSVDPNCKVVAVAGPDPGNPVVDPNYAFYRGIFGAGGLNYMDILSVHMYLDPNSIGHSLSPGDEHYIHDWASALRSLMAEYGPVRPIWDSESGLLKSATMYTVPSRLKFYSGDVGGLTSIEHAAYGIRIMAIHAVEDVKWFYYTNIPLGRPCSFFEYDGTPVALSVAWTQFSKEMGGCRYVEQVYVGVDKQAYLFDRSGTPVVMIWCTDYTPSQSTTLQTLLGQTEVVQRDIFGNQITNSMGGSGVILTVSGSPIYLIGQGITLQQMKQKLQQ